jgi:hypothetical protein
LPQGSVVSVRGIPERKGRRLVLSDGQREVPFVDDGSGSVVARWTLNSSASLRVAARFGEVLVPEPEVLELNAVADQAPQIELEDAPRAVQLRDVESVEFRYVASDDHGLREVDLVLRSGAREERRSLVRLDGQSRVERGAHALSVRDPFLRRMFLPVVATIEARDTDVAHGSKWGQSAAITILPPAVGEPQALRYRALLEARGKLVDLLGFELDSERARKERAEASLLRDRERQKAKLRSEALIALRSAVAGAFAGARVSGGLSAFVLGQARALETRPSDSRRRTEDVILAFDAATRALASRDATEVAKRLGDVAEEAAEGAKVAIGGEKRRQGERRLNAALEALDRGSANLLILGALGADVGSVALGEIRRIRRAQATPSFSDAELAARHLAARLRRPNPSFSSAGGGGVESGRGAQQGPGEASDADRQFDQLMQELDQLAAEHAQQIQSVEESLAESAQETGSDDLKREALERANRLRERLAALPDPGALPGSARAAAALGREHMNAMAQNLERLALKDAVEGGRRAKSQIDEAARIAREPRSPSDWLDEAAVSGASRELDEQLAWAERALERQRQQASARAAKDLVDAAGREEGLARRAGNLAGRGDHSEAKLPDDVQESLERAESAMRQAARELSEGRGDAALESQREAQRLLERSNPGKTSDADESQGKRGREDEGGNDDAANSARVPAADKARRAEDFRRRVLQGLAKERRGRLAPAVERYAEGLLE